MIKFNKLGYQILVGVRQNIFLKQHKSEHIFSEECPRVLDSISDKSQSYLFTQIYLN